VPGRGAASIGSDDIHHVAAWADPPNAFLDAYRRGDYAEVLRIIRPDAERGVPMVQSFLADMYFKGLGLPKDEAQQVSRRAVECPAGALANQR
jgi:hypothetical protein